MTASLKERVHELEQLVMLQQGQIIALLTLELARIGRGPDALNDASALIDALREVQPEPETRLGAGYASVLESFEEALDAARDEALHEAGKTSH